MGDLYMCQYSYTALLLSYSREGGVWMWGRVGDALSRLGYMLVVLKEFRSWGRHAQVQRCISGSP